MNIVRHESIKQLKYQSECMLTKMLSPFSGLSQEIGYVSRTQGDMRLIVGSAALTGVHVLFDRPNPGRGAYHIGGTGIFPNESMIRILGESVERYAQLMSELSFISLLKFASYDEIVKSGEKVLPFNYLSLYSDHQLKRKGFPFERVDKSSKLSWIKMKSFTDKTSVWIPAQFILVGYNVRNKEGEPWITSAVTTGTAAHINYESAFKSALLELIQLDSVMGHWYSEWKIFEIILDNRVLALFALIQKYSSGGCHQYKFYYLPNPDLAGFSIACVYLQNNGLPKVVIGLGADDSLESAMYKAFLETVASVGLARMVVFKGKYEIDKHSSLIEPDNLYDLDRNVEYYGMANNFDRIKSRFLSMPTIKAMDLPSDICGEQTFLLDSLITSFSRNNKQLYFLDLTGEEEMRLGFKVVRVWSPDTLSLCLPSAPQMLHARFNFYGGITHEDPHPYP